ncbi:MAG: hypothetical protein LBK61_05670 [Spirochaetaceae bacterium]|jgi:hypothetical protein|nr:hypothetical protein [Spirochaetaceae bacterium]
MKMYMGFSAEAGPCECAVLIFADSAKEAKKLLWKNNPFGIFDDYIDLRVALIKDKPFLEKERQREYPHIVDCPATCSHCEGWGISEIGADGLCDDCRELKEDSNGG